VRWQRAHGRKGLPWQGSRDPYRVWLSEVMLQQTQVGAVIPYYERFLRKFPDVGALAAASEDEVLQLWSGLGYYARGRNLHAAAKAIAAHGFPDTAQEIQELPGVGQSTAAAIAAFAFGRRAAILDGNVKRVLARQFLIASEKDLWEKAEELLPTRNIEAYTQALMDLGATVCVRRNPRCGACPVRAGCVARKEGRIDELPARKAKKALPQRRSTWYVFRLNGQVLLERRPGKGIWGGLWTFPETPLYRSGKPRRLPTIEHGFTHFRLRVQPLLCELRGKAARAEPPGRLWIDVDQAVNAAVPAPVRALLESISAAR
jgi:A/G-specific adenine glycosylase